jgi:hypothetical protein
MDKIGDMAVKTGILKQRIPVSDLLARDFIPTDVKAANIKMADAS